MDGIKADDDWTCANEEQAGKQHVMTKPEGFHPRELTNEMAGSRQGQASPNEKADQAESEASYESLKHRSLRRTAPSIVRFAGMASAMIRTAAADGKLPAGGPV
jgi:hypothetical protein